MSNDDKDLTIEELLKRAKQVPDEKIIVDAKLTEAQRFAIAHNIKAGDHRIWTAQIYKMYKEWKGYGIAQGKTAFFRDFSKLFTRAKDDRQRYYLLDPEPFKLSEEEYWATRKFLRKEKERYKNGKKKKSIKKKQNKKSST